MIDCDGLLSRTQIKGDVMADGQDLQISIGGSPLAIIDGLIYALIVPDLGGRARDLGTRWPLVIQCV